MFIYKTTNLVNGKIYIGQHKNDDPNYLGSGTILKSAFDKYGRENFKREILFKTDCREELNNKEAHYIKIFNSTDKRVGYNIMLGCEVPAKYRNQPYGTVVQLKREHDLIVKNYPNFLYLGYKAWFRKEGELNRFCISLWDKASNDGWRWVKEMNKDVLKNS